MGEDTEKEAEEMARGLKVPLDREQVFKKLEKAYQIIRFNDEFDLEKAQKEITDIEDMLGFTAEEMNQMTKEVNDKLH